MLKKLFALSDKGAKDLKGGILACAFYNLCTMIPVVILVKIISELLKAVETGEILLQEKKAFYLIATVILFLLIFISQWIQYQKTYTVAYAESKNRRFVLAEKLRRLPLSFFGNKNIADLTTTIMGDCTALEKNFSNAIPTLFGTVLTFCLISVGLLITDWRMGLCILFPVPLAGLVLLMAKKSQQKAESDNLEAKRSAYDGVQEYLDTISELKSSCLTEDYLSGLEKKLDTVVQCSFRNEVVPGSALTAAQFILRFGLVAVLLVGGILVGKGTLSVVMFLMFILVAGRIYDPFSSCFMMLAEIFSAMVSVNRMKEMESETEQTGDSAFNPQGYDITFKDVHFAYDKPCSPYDELRFIDDSGEDVPDGQPGELITRGAYTIRNYYGMDDKQNQYFTPDGFYRTGDKAYLDENQNLIILGRAKEQINRGGEKIMPGEIEELLLQHEHITECAVAGIPDEVLGNRICVFAVSDGAELSLQEIREFLKAKGLADFKLPDQLQQIETMPYTAAKKIDKKKLTGGISVG